MIAQLRFSPLADLSGVPAPWIRATAGDVHTSLLGEAANAVLTPVSNALAQALRGLP